MTRYLYQRYLLEDMQRSRKAAMMLWKKRRAARIPDYNPEGIDEVYDPRDEVRNVNQT